MKCISDEYLNGVCHLIVASACEANSARWKEGLFGIDNLHHIDNLNLLQDKLLQLEPDVLLLDGELPGLDGVHGIYELRKICPDTKIVILNKTASDEDEWAMFRAGVRGCCPTDIKPSSLKMMVDAVQSGELWIRRSLTRRILEQLEHLESKPEKNSKIKPHTLGLLDSLTHREYEIAVKVGNGESNKQIAVALEITERTVKAHLTKIFNKLGVSDRLKVALILSADKRQERRGSQKSTGNNSTFHDANA